eukprot:scaffold1207_cov371-Pavlova_lutheri.AAC.8
MEPLKERGKEGKERRHAAVERQDPGNHGDGALSSAHRRPPCRHGGGRGRGSVPPRGVHGHSGRARERMQGAPADAP